MIFKKIYKAKPVKIIRRFVLSSAVIGFLFILVVLPYRISLTLGRIMAYFVCFLAKTYRKKTEENLKRAFPELSPIKIMKLRNKVYDYMGMNVVDFALLSFKPSAFWLKRVEIEGREIIERIISNGKGVIYLTAHIGNWELMGAYLSMIGFPINVVAREIYEPRLNWLLTTLRSRRNVETIFRSGQGNTKKMIAALKRGEVLGILVDQDTEVGGVFVEFFGDMAYTPTAINQFSRLKNTEIVSGFIFRKEDKSHKIVISGPIDKGEDEVKETQKHTSIIENFIRKHPAQWVWMHPRWKTKVA